MYYNNKLGYTGITLAALTAGYIFAAEPVERKNKSNKEVISTNVKPNIDISTENMAQSAELLNKILADEYVLYTKTLNYHWNVRGMSFGPLHDFFKKQYEELSNFVDEVAERVRSIGHLAAGTLQEFSQLTRLQEEPGKTLSEKEMIKKLLNDHESIIRTLRVDQETCMTTLKDAGTSNFLLNLLEKHEKMAWMLRAFLE